jgi:hypothetical protein
VQVVPPRTRLPEEPYPAQELAPAQRQALEDLRADGIAVTTFRDLVDDDGLWRELEADMGDYVARARERMPDVERPKTKDDFLVRRWAHSEHGGGLDGTTIPSDSPWLRFATSDRLLGVVNSYRGVYTKLVGFDNMLTVPFPENDRRIASQRWHRDPEDRHVVKCILYFSDVDAEAGPFEYVAGSAPGGRYGDAWAWGTSWLTERGAEERWYPPQDELEALISPTDRVQLVGPKGTLALCDTSGFHRGGFARTRPRVVSIHTYISPSAEYDRMNFSVGWQDEGAQLSPHARYALS